MPKVEVNGIRLNYEIAGNGPLVVMNHGITGDLARMRPVMERLKDDYTVLAWDNRGCGESETGGPYSLRVFSEDLYGLLKAVGIERSVVYGVSWGGVLSQRFTLDHPEMVSALILDSTSSVVNKRAAEGWLAQGRAALRGAPFGGSGDPEAFMGRCEAVVSIKDQPMTPELARITCPTFVLVGENDDVAGVGGSVIIHRNIAGSRLLIVPDCGHAVCFEAPEVFDREFREFMASLVD